MFFFVNEDICVIYFCLFFSQKTSTVFSGPSFLSKQTNKQNKQQEMEVILTKVNNLELYLALLSS